LVESGIRRGENRIEGFPIITIGRALEEGLKGRSGGGEQGVQERIIMMMMMMMRKRSVSTEGGVGVSV